jgi:heavy metal translocating P-type ATPase
MAAVRQRTSRSTDEHEPAQQPVEAPEAERSRWRRLARMAWHHPVPSLALTLLLVSLSLWLAGRADLAQWPLLAIVLLGGVPLFWETLGQVKRREFGVDVLALLAIAGSLLLQEYLAGALIVLMLSGGNALEAFALRKARRSLTALAERAPRVAHVWRDQELVTVAAEEIAPGMHVVVKPGEVVPVDGVVVDGAASVSEADLTGEPLPVRKEAGAQVLSGSVSLDAMLTIQALRPSAESKYAQIVRLVEEAQARKAPIHRLADRYSAGFTVAALALAALAWIVTRDSVYALAVLVVATPCPLILATPIAIMSGIDLAARHGLIVKSGAVIEQLGEVDVAVFDKTGTLTLGSPAVTDIVFGQAGHADTGRAWTHDELLRLAASVEQLSSHILAHAVVAAAAGRGLDLAPTQDFEEVFGKGVRGRVTVADAAEATGRRIQVALGNRTFMRQLGVPLPADLSDERERRTARGEIASFVAIEGKAVALLVLADTPRPELTRLVPALKANGIQQTVLLTGDSEVVGQLVGAQAGVDRVIARCLPDDKVRVVRELHHARRRVLMVGDGVNDAPALAAATVGLALGVQGLTAASSAADAVLLSSDILRVPLAVRIGRHALHVALQSIWIGMGLSSVAMVFAAFGFIEPAAGAVLQEGIDVLVILNALRAGRVS